MEQANQLGELISFWIVGMMAGLLFEREKSLLQDLVQANEETLLGLVAALDMKNSQKGSCLNHGQLATGEAGKLIF